MGLLVPVAVAKDQWNRLVMVHKVVEILTFITLDAGFFASIGLHCTSALETA